jgi:hypothetical protein
MLISTAIFAERLIVAVFTVLIEAGDDAPLAPEED